MVKSHSLAEAEIGYLTRIIQVNAACFKIGLFIDL
jgi:hypothetical protein